MDHSLNVNHDVLPLQKGMIYGPVKSRRLGGSLGINLLPTEFKLCSFNCIYCQYGQTQPMYLVGRSPRCYKLPTVVDLEKALLAAFSNIKEEFNYITFSGNGEPTLHPDFAEMVDMVIALRDKYYPQVRTALLSNGTMLGKKAVFEAVRKIDCPIIKLDAGTAELFSTINRPAAGIELDAIVEKLTQLNHPGLKIQALFLGGDKLNCSDKNLRRWVQLLKRMNPTEVQIYSLDRPSALNDTIKVPRSILRHIAERTRILTGVPVYSY